MSDKIVVKGHGRDQYELHGDGQSVWVNSRTGCLGRHHRVVVDDEFRPEYTKPEGYV